MQNRQSTNDVQKTYCLTDADVAWFEDITTSEARGGDAIRFAEQRFETIVNHLQVCTACAQRIESTLTKGDGWADDHLDDLDYREQLSAFLLARLRVELAARLQPAGSLLRSARSSGGAFRPLALAAGSKRTAASRGRA